MPPPQRKFLDINYKLNYNGCVYTHYGPSQGE